MMYSVIKSSRVWTAKLSKKLWELTRMSKNWSSSVQFRGNPSERERKNERLNLNLVAESLFFSAIDDDFVCNNVFSLKVK